MRTKKMIKRVKNLKPSVLLSQETYREYIESFESETIRGIATILILKIIKNYGELGIYGYKILQKLKKETNDMLVIEEGRLYPMLRKLEKWGPKGNEIQLVTSKRIKKEGSRTRNYYYITKEGNMILHHLEGVFFKMLQSISGLVDYKVELIRKDIIFCPNCSNMIAILDDGINFCEICGLNISDLKENIIKNNINKEKNYE